MRNELKTIDAQTLQDKIHTIRGLAVMLDRDLAELYGVQSGINLAMNASLNPQSLILGQDLFR